MNRTQGAIAIASLVLGCAVSVACEEDGTERVSTSTRVSSAKIDPAMLNAGDSGVEHGSLIGGGRGGRRIGWDRVRSRPKGYAATSNASDAKKLDGATDDELHKDELDEAIRKAVIEDSRPDASPELPFDRVPTTGASVPAPPREPEAPEPARP